MTRAVLPIGALLVLGLGVYLFVEVRAQPVQPLVVGHAAPAADRALAPVTTPDEPAPSVAPSVSSTPTAAAAAATAPSVAPVLERGGSADEAVAGPKLDAVMAEANKAYDRGDFDEAKTIASRLLARLPTNVRMLRIMVSASCLDGDAAVAQAHYTKLPPADQEQMKVRCARYGITFSDKP